MAIIETANGDDGVAITGTASPGERTVGVLGQGESVGIKGVGTRWHGVEGISHSTIGGFGVYGANTAGGTGVVGESKKWMGVYGKSESTTGGHGVMGEAVGTGVVGVSKTWLGVYGETSAAANAGAAGVWGDGKDGSEGVKGLTKAANKAAVAGFHLANSGPGVYGKGAPAGMFEGDVVATGNVTSRGVSMQQLLRRLTELELRVAGLEARSGGQGQGTLPPGAAVPQISVIAEGSGASTTLAVQGSGFEANKPVSIRVADDAMNPERRFQNSADANGKLGARIPIACNSGFNLHVSATDGRPNASDLTGFLWSNTFTVPCP